MPRSQFSRDVYRFVAGPLGHVEGVTVSSSSNNEQQLCHYFGGLPYALPPVGPHRFRRPRKIPDRYRYGTKANPGRFTGSAAYCPQPRRAGKGPDAALWDEDCLQLNIYIPAGKQQPEKGWPVFFYIHGGFLQWGDPNDPPTAMASLLGETAFEAVIVAPAYRLNSFGFIASKELQAEAEKLGETAGNMGFWDQRTALEWTAKNIGHFGGDPNNITIGGYSAGSHSAFHQLAHELYFVPDDKAVIKRTIMWSNSPGVQPRTAQQHQAQFDELLSALNIPLSLSADEKLERLRDVPISKLIEIQETLRISEFRATTDDAFVSKHLIANINNGDFGRRMLARGIKLMNGECRDEHASYQTWRTPSQSYESVRTRLIGDYPATVVDELMQHYCNDSKSLPVSFKDWQDLFGHIYADMQVHNLERGLHSRLQEAGLVIGRDLLRYRFDWRAGCIDGSYPPEQGVTHGTDIAIWFWGLAHGEGLSDADKEVLKPWNKAFADFVKGVDPQWGTKSVKEMKRLRSDGGTDVWLDDRWESGLQVWNLVNADSGKGLIGWIRARL